MTFVSPKHKHKDQVDGVRATFNFYTNKRNI